MFLNFSRHWPSPHSIFPPSDSPLLHWEISCCPDNYWISPSERISVDCTFRSLGLLPHDGPGLEDVLLPWLFPKVTKWNHHLLTIHVQTLVALTQDPFGPALGWFLLILSRDWSPYTKIWYDLLGAPPLGAKDRETPHFRCSLYYEIRGHYHCLYRDSGGSLSTLFQYPNWACIALFIREIFRHRSQILHTLPHWGPF